MFVLARDPVANSFLTDFHYPAGLAATFYGLVVPKDTLSCSLLGEESLDCITGYGAGLPLADKVD